MTSLLDDTSTELSHELFNSLNNTSTPREEFSAIKDPREFSAPSTLEVQHAQQIPLGREHPKSVASRSRKDAFLRSLLHVPAISMTLGTLSLNFRGVFWQAPTSYTNTVLNILQFVAKIQESLMLFSLTAIVLHRIRWEVMTRNGVPFGLLSSGLQYSSIGISIPNATEGASDGFVASVVLDWVSPGTNTSTGLHKPLVQVECATTYPTNSSSAIITFPSQYHYPQSTAQEAWMMPLAKIIAETNFSLSNDIAIFQWVDLGLPHEIGPSATAIFFSSSPFSSQSDTTVACTIDAIWMPSEVWVDPTVDEAVHETISDPLEEQYRFAKTDSHMTLASSWLNLLNVQFDVAVSTDYSSEATYNTSTAITNTMRPWLIGSQDLIVILDLDIYQYGYGYGMNGTGIYIAATILLIYVVLTLIHMAVMIFGSWSSNAWSTPGELIALAVSSSPTDLLYNTCAGIEDPKTWNWIVQVQETKEAHLELVFNEQIDRIKDKEAHNERQSIESQGEQSSTSEQEKMIALL
ncbi:hypothetical protein G7Y89_g8771 [Cudoniella acicularis]|uniref:Uncharacterized protein n=1 Tax=Cudoniella acicularis TaxID=354080 RepID=A0A8H4RFZ0_9HELO|nr:hypothetical protein G7Y89_g8771 [Cudoniella acicularis]